MLRGAFNKFPDFFVQAFRIVVDSWKLSMLLLYLLWDGWPIFDQVEQLQYELEYTLLKPACRSYGEFQIAIWMWGHFRIYAI